MITKIISGAQSGVDRAALDFALKFNIPHGGWIPKGTNCGRRTITSQIPTPGNAHDPVIQNGPNKM